MIGHPVRRQMAERRPAGLGGRRSPARGPPARRCGRRAGAARGALPAPTSRRRPLQPAAPSRASGASDARAASASDFVRRRGAGRRRTSRRNARSARAAPPPTRIPGQRWRTAHGASGNAGHGMLTRGSATAGAIAAHERNRSRRDLRGADEPAYRARRSRPSKRAPMATDCQPPAASIRAKPASRVETVATLTTSSLRDPVPARASPANLRDDDDRESRVQRANRAGAEAARRRAASAQTVLRPNRSNAPRGRRNRLHRQPADRRQTRRDRRSRHPGARAGDAAPRLCLRFWASSTETVLVEGSVIARITPIDTMTSSLGLLYKATKTWSRCSKRSKAACRTSQHDLQRSRRDVLGPLDACDHRRHRHELGPAGDRSQVARTRAASGCGVRGAVRRPLGRGAGCRLRVSGGAAAPRAVVLRRWRRAPRGGSSSPRRRSPGCGGRMPAGRPVTSTKGSGSDVH